MATPDFDATHVGLHPGQTVFGRYTLLRSLGRGGMGVVWLARDAQLEQEVALKFLPEALAHDPAAINDLKRETRRSLQLTHPHIVRIYDFLEDGRGTAAVSMEYVDGATLTQRRLERPAQVFSPAELQPWVEQLCEALEYAHAKAKIAHRDLKPANLMIDARGDLKVADFGISATLSETATRASQRVGSSGTPVYMSPQQMLGEKPAATDDLYSLGATLYELLTGKPPFYAGNIFVQVEQKVPPSLAARRAELEVGKELEATGGRLAPIPAAWEATIASCLAKDPKKRPSSARAVAACLRGDGPPALAADDATVPLRRSTRMRVRWPFWAALLCTLSVAGWHLGGPWLKPTPPPDRAAQIRSDTATQDRPAEAAPGPVGPDLGQAAAEKAAAEAQAEKARQAAEAEARAKAEQVKQAAAAEAAQRAKVEREKQAEEEAARLRAERERQAAEEAARKQAAQEKQAAEAAARAQAEREKAAAEAQAEKARQAAARGGLVVRTEPLGAEVSVGEGIQGTAPLLLKQLALGKYPVRVRLAGYEEWTGEAEVKTDEFAEVAATLARSAGTLSLGSLPSGVEVEIRGERLEAPGESFAPKKLKTPAKVELPTGAYTVTFRRAGWPEQAQTVTVPRKATATATAEFVPGALTVTSEPSGAEIVGHGQVLATTPQTWSDLPPGRCQLELRQAGYQPATVSGEVVARQTLRLSAKLEKLAGPTAGSAMTIPDLKLELVPIPAGRFAMGSTNGDSDERPVTQVELTRPFWLGKTEVTQAQWEAVMGDNPATFKGANLPVESVSYDDALAFCRKLTARERAAKRLPEGYEYTLPTEAQWEYACRAGTTGDYSFGNSADELSRYGNYCDRSNTNDFDWKDRSHDDGYDKTAPVGSYRPNAWGLYDMHGNVWEWCLDWKGDYAGGTVRDPVGPSSGANRVLRGGSWFDSAGRCRSANRGNNGPGGRSDNLGFRLALSSVP